MARHLRARLLVLAIGLAGCDSGIELDVDVKTDLVAGEEFDVVSTTILDGSASASGRVIEARATAGADFARGVRVAAFSDLAPGSYLMRVRLARSSGLLVVERTVRVNIDDSYVVTVVITRNCRGVTCPMPGGDATAVACLGGRCVSPDCIVERPETCGSPACGIDSDCPAMATCALPRCVSGACLLEPRNDRCATGEYCSPELGCRARTLDAGPDPTDGGVDRDAATCSACDDGNACTDDTCPSGGTCVHGTRDLDGDGHGDTACPSVGGIPSDDCDDANSLVHPGAIDGCNGVDDDCTGAIDPACGCDPGTWQLATIDARTAAGADVSMIATPDGALHASYSDTSGHDLVYAYHAPGGWWTSASLELIGEPTQLDYARASDGTEHLAYYDQPNGDLWYGRRAAGAAVWDLSTVDATGNVGAAPSIALGSADTVHITYYDATARDLKHASRTGAAAWAVEAVDTAGDVGQTSTLMVGADGTLSVAYVDATTDDLEWAERPPGGAWLRQTIDMNGGTAPSLAIDATGRPHVVYRIQSSRTVTHAERAMDGTWSSEPILASAEVAADRALAIAPSGALVVVYRIEASGDLGLSEKNVGGTWSATTIDASTTDVGMYASVAVDLAGRVHVAYHDRSGGELRYAARAPAATTFDFETADGRGFAGRFAAMVVDELGSVFVAHATGSGPQFASRSWRPAGGIWHRETVDATGNTGEHSDIAVTPSGAVHIAYHDLTLTAARFARRDSPGAAWALETVDNSAVVGRFAQIELGSGGVDHVAYCDDTNQSVRYAFRGTGGAWTTEVASGPLRMRRGQYASLTLDSGGLPRVLYFNNATDDLAIVERSAGAMWTPQVLVDESGSIGRYVTSASDATGGTWAAYSGGAAGDVLKAAYRTPAGGWTFTPSTMLGDLSVDETSITVAPDDTVYVAYHDVTVIMCDPFGACVTADRLGVHSRPASGTWSAISPNAALGANASTAIALARGELFVAYYSSGQGLRIARRCR